MTFNIYFKRWFAVVLLVITIILVVSKMTKIIDIPMLFVFLPLWGPCLFIGIIVALVILIYGDGN